jgi:hypothetical protein
MPSTAQPFALLCGWLRRQLAAPAVAWFDDAVAKLAGEYGDRDLYLLVSLVARKLGKDDLALSADELAAADAARSGWDPREWSVDQAGRIALLLATAGDPEERFTGHVEQLCTTADVAELVGFYRGLPLYPHQERYVRRAAEGARTNMKAVFEAVAHRNPYPAEQFDDIAWNHLVLKALFIGSTLYPIQGLERRANPALMRMLCDYAHERWAASRPISPELWRCVGPYADAAALADLQRVLETGDAAERQAAALALAACPQPDAKALLDREAALRDAIAKGSLSWDTLGNA